MKSHNSCPISVLPDIARLFDQLHHYLDADRFLSPEQSGFRLHHLTAMRKCTDDWYNGLDTSQMNGLVFIDLKNIRHI